MINLVDVSQLIDLHELLEHRVVEECMALFNSNGTYRKTQKSKLIQKFSLQPVDLQEPYIALIDMGMIWRMATPTAEDRQTQDGTGLIMSRRYHLSSLLVITMLLVSSVLMTPMTQPTPLKMMSETYEYRVGLMSPIST